MGQVAAWVLWLGFGGVGVGLAVLSTGANQRPVFPSGSLGLLISGWGLGFTVEIER